MIAAKVINKEDVDRDGLYFALTVKDIDCVSKSDLDSFLGKEVSNFSWNFYLEKMAALKEDEVLLIGED